MFHNFFVFLFIFFFAYGICIHSQDDAGFSDSIEVYLIDSYISPENPNKFILSFYTSDTCKSIIKMNDKYEFPVSLGFKENHRTEIDINGLHFSGERIPFTIIVEKADGKKNQSEKFEIQISGEKKIEAKENYVLNCILGGVVFLIPQPEIQFKSGQSLFALTKELPLITHFSGGYNYPQSYFSVEYTHILKSDKKNFFRIGLKQLFEIPKIEFVSLGVNYFSNFKGHNGISPEVTFGLFQINSTFTACLKYRFNFSPEANSNEFHEINIGLFSSFFSFHY